MAFMLIETKTIRLRFDDRFTSQLVNFEGGSVWVTRDPKVPPLPLFNFALSERVDFYEGCEEKVAPGAYEDGDEAGRYRAVILAYFDMKAEGANSFEDSTIDVAGRLAYVRTSEMVMPLYGDEEVFRLFVNIPLDDAFSQEFSAVCRPQEREEYEPLFWETIRGAEFLGDRVEAIRVQEEARAEMYARVDAAIEKAEGLSASVASGAVDELAGVVEQDFDPFVPPADGGSRFRLGGFDLEFIEEESSVGTTSFTNQFGFTFVGRVADPKAAAKARLTSEHNTEAKIEFPIYFGGGYGSGSGPEARLLFVEDKCAEPYINASIKGLEYGLRYTGLVEIKDGWVSLRGKVSCSYDRNQPEFDVEVWRPFDPQEVDWAQYAFASLSELEAASPEVVRYVALKNAELDTIPPSVLRCKQLVRLSVPIWGGGKSVSMKVPSGLGDLSLLTHLDLSGRVLEALPDSIGDLANLETLNLGDCDLSRIPEQIWGLARLQYLFLRGNRIASIPEGVDLPGLYSLDIKDNALRTIPASLTTQAKLRTIKLTGNPLESLPDVFNDCAVDVELSIDDKRRLLDYEYRGADGQGAVVWDEDAYYVRSDPDRAAAAAAWLAGSEFAAHQDALHFLLKRSVGFAESGEEDYGIVGSHRFGGMPDLPPEIPYPRFRGDEESEHAYEFIAQVDCAALASLQTYLPRTGLLYFFLSTAHDLYGHADRAAQVLHFAGSSEGLQSGRDLRIDPGDYHEMMDGAYPAMRVEAAAMTSAPEFYAARQNPHLFRGPAAGLRDLADALERIDEDDGFAAMNSGGPFGFEMNAYAFTQHEDPEHQVAVRQKGSPEDWTVLLKVRSRGGFMWGDAGDLSYVIHKSDLAKGDFTNVYCTIESS